MRVGLDMFGLRHFSRNILFILICLSKYYFTVILFTLVLLAVLIRMERLGFCRSHITYETPMWCAHLFSSEKTIHKIFLCIYTVIWISILYLSFAIGFCVLCDFWGGWCDDGILLGFSPLLAQKRITTATMQE